MRQQLLDLRLTPHYDYGSWVRHRGVENAQNRLALWMVHGGRLRLGSKTPAGKTHLLHALVQEHPRLGLVTISHEAAANAGRQVQAWLEHLGNHACWLVDAPAMPLPYATAIALFHLLERAREMNRSVAIAWRQPVDAHTPPELTSRLAAMECAQMVPPESDTDLMAVLNSVAVARQWAVNHAVLQLMLTRLSRHLPDLIAALEEMENASLTERSRLTRSWASKRIEHLRRQKQAEPPAPAEPG